MQQKRIGRAVLETSVPTHPRQGMVNPPTRSGKSLESPLLRTARPCFYTKGVRWTPLPEVGTRAESIALLSVSWDGPRTGRLTTAWERPQNADSWAHPCPGVWRWVPGETALSTSPPPPLPQGSSKVPPSLKPGEKEKRKVGWKEHRLPKLTAPGSSPSCGL